MIRGSELRTLRLKIRDLVVVRTARNKSPVDYVVSTGGRRRRKQNVHVNLLQKWEERERISFLADIVSDKEMGPTISHCHLHSTPTES